MKKIILLGLCIFGTAYSGQCFQLKHYLARVPLLIGAAWSCKRFGGYSTVEDFAEIACDHTMQNATLSDCRREIVRRVLYEHKLNDQDIALKLSPLPGSGAGSSSLSNGKKYLFIPPTEQECPPSRRFFRRRADDDDHDKQLRKFEGVMGHEASHLYLQHPEQRKKMYVFRPLMAGFLFWLGARRGNLSRGLMVSSAAFAAGVHMSRLQRLRHELEADMYASQKPEILKGLALDLAEHAPSSDQKTDALQPSFTPCDFNDEAFINRWYKILFGSFAKTETHPPTRMRIDCLKKHAQYIRECKEKGVEPDSMESAYGKGTLDEHALVIT